MRNLLLVIAIAVALVGCGSTVDLADVPVVDKAGSAVSSADAAGAGGSAAGRAGVADGSVASVDLDNESQKGAIPVGARIVYFDHDSFLIKPEFQSIIETHAAFIKKNRALRVAIEGHTDETGGREYNLALGQKRAEAVRSAMGLLGVPDSQIEAVSFGKEKPAVLGSDEGAMSQNRRAEITYR